jgi:hypothetical protein
VLVSLLFSIALIAAGSAVLRMLGLSKGVVGLGLTPAAGLAGLAVVCAWPALLGAPAPTAGALLLGLALLGIGLAARDRAAVRDALRQGWRDQRAAVLLLTAALLVPAATMGVAFAGVVAPLSPHDGAFHTQVIHQLRSGARWTGSWYPPGTHAIFAAALQLLPWVDSAQGTFELGLSLTILAPLAVFGLGCAVLHDLRVAAAGAVLISLTYLFPYFNQMWSGLPLAIGLLLVLGLWTAAAEYIARPSVGWAVLCGLLVGAMVLVHGTELYSSVLVLLVLLGAAWRKLDWRRLPAHAGLAVGLALVCGLPYLPVLLGWAAGGGATAVGAQEGGAVESAVTTTGGDLLASFGLNALGVDLPVRLVLVPIGVWWVLRHARGRSLVVVTALFGILTLVFTLGMGLPLARTAFALTFPWGMAYRLLMLVAVGLALLGGAGGVWLVAQIGHRTRSPRAMRLGRVLLGTWVVLTAWALTIELQLTGNAVNTMSGDDVAAMAWLREHAQPGEVLANDWSGDGGIWAPYKAGVAVVMPRDVPNDGSLAARTLVLEHVTDLPSVAETACELHVAYVYRGAVPVKKGWEERHFPPLDTLRASPALEEVFTSGQAAVFRTRLRCD